MAEKEVYVGAVIEINQKQINLIPSTPINQIDKRGLKLALDKPLELGTFGAAMQSICDDIKVENPLSEAKIKEIGSPLLQKAANKLTSANMRIEALQYEQPPTKYKAGSTTEKAEEQDPTKYVFVASVNWEDSKDDASKTDENNSKDFFKLKGLIFGVSSGFTNAETNENLEVTKAFQSALQAMTPVASLPASKTEAKPINQTATKNNTKNATVKDQEAS